MKSSFPALLALIIAAFNRADDTLKKILIL